MGEQTFGEAGGGDQDYPRRCGTTLCTALYQIQSKYKYKQTDKYREADTKYAKRKSAITSYRDGRRYDGPTPPSA